MTRKPQRRPSQKGDEKNPLTMLFMTPVFAAKWLKRYGLESKYTIYKPNKVPALRYGLKEK